MKNFYGDYKIGILGGGQLGKMLIQSAADFNLHIRVMDPVKHAPCAKLASEFVLGDLNDYNAVYKFGHDLDLVTIEIESVNTEALKTLEETGVKVFPQPHIIEMIQDKRTQKQFYHNHDIPTAPFQLVSNQEALIGQRNFLPAVQKIGKGGYDGKGVKVMNTPMDLCNGFDAPSVLEKLVDIHKEISVIVARNESGDVQAYPPVELVYHKEQNLVDYLISPAAITKDAEQEAIQIAKTIVSKLEYVGLLAVELFIDSMGRILVNEVAPRPHNSGHQTIEGNYTSQYEQMWRAILDMPLGDTRLRCPSAMVNLLGEEYQTGPAYYDGLNDLMAIEGTHLHLYGKKITKPFRKMGHVTIIDNDIDNLKEKVEDVKQSVKVVSI